MTRARDVANVLSTATSLATDTETAAAISSHNTAANGHVGRGTTGNRPGSPATGDLYYDTTINNLIRYNGTSWVEISPIPNAPTSVSATAEDALATVSFTAPTNTLVSSYTATSSPGNITGSSTSSPITVSGLTNNTAYTFTVTATNVNGTSFASSASNSVTPAVLGAFESIATVTVGAGGSAEINFTSIPSTYQHLQLRFISQDTASGQYFLIQFNGETSNTKYTWHSLEGNGTTATVFANATGTHSGAVFNYAAGSTGSIFSAGIVDILDYKDTNKNKTVRSLGGYDANGIGYAQLQSDLFLSTAAISSIKIIYNSGNFAQYSHIALYGIKG